MKERYRLLAHSGRLSLRAIDFSDRPPFSSHASSLYLEETLIVKSSSVLVSWCRLRVPSFRPSGSPVGGKAPRHRPRKGESSQVLNMLPSLL